MEPTIRYMGTQGTSGLHLFDYSMASTGLTEKAALRAGNNVKTITIRLTTSEGVTIMNPIKLRKALETFLIEDIGDQDLTSDSIFPREQLGTGLF
ncbi:hypothetical protein R0K20_16925, partial [Staphylococcus sp. SIMBA_130]